LSFVLTFLLKFSREYDGRVCRPTGYQVQGNGFIEELTTVVSEE
jgi:hypothetical protein